MKKYIITLSAVLFTLCVGLSSCVGDLDVTPIDPSLTLPEEVLNSESAFEAVLAKCYGGLSVSSSEGPDKDPDIEGIDGGFGQYMRALFYNNEVPTDEANIVWNDNTIHNLHRLNWTTSDLFVTAMFSRIYYQISLCNEFIRRAKASEFAGSSNMKTWIAEARALRALSYYHAIDMFGNVPFATEENSVGSTGPKQIMRADLYTWLVDEIKDFEGDLVNVRSNEYGRVDKGLAMMLLAKLYLNAEVYTNGAVKAYNECATECKQIMNAYPSLHSNYAELFMADNNNCTDEIIFAVESDGVNTQNYGSTTFVIKASVESGNVDWQASLGVNDGWGGITVTPEFIDQFDDNDVRKMFTDGSEFATTKSDNIHTYEMTDDASFTSGYSSTKFKNLNSDGSAAQAQNFPDTDYPVFRTADAYLMLAESVLRGASTATSAEGLAAYNAVHQRAGLPAVSSISLDDVLAERGRELYFENFRRSDLVRFGKFTTDEYLWSFKGGVQSGASVDSRYNLFPIPSTEINSNSNLVQNAGY